MDSWQLIVSPDRSGEENMRIDLELFRRSEEEKSGSTLRFYSWKPRCISLGYSQIIEREIDGKNAKGLGWDVIKRPTGGGIVFHNRAEVTYSLVTAIDNPLLPSGMIPAYKKISAAVVLGLSLIGVKAEISKPNLEPACRQARLRTSNMGLCFSYPAEYEIVVEGRKLVGSAQKRGKRALLQQGSIFVRGTDPAAFSLLRKPGQAYNAVSVEEILGREIKLEELVKALIKGFESELNVVFK